MPTRNVPVAGIRNLPPPVEGKRAAAAPAGRGRAMVGPAGNRHRRAMDAGGAGRDVRRRVAGRGNNPRIMEYHATTTLGSQPDSVPWCSSFVNWCLRQVGLRGTNSAAAASWVNWGQGLETPRYGCIVQLRTARQGHDRATGSSSGNHVAFFVSQTATHITLLGGNQSNQVKESNYRLSSYDIRAMRWPNRRMILLLAMAAMAVPAFSSAEPALGQEGKIRPSVTRPKAPWPSAKAGAIIGHALPVPRGTGMRLHCGRERTGR